MLNRDMAFLDSLIMNNNNNDNIMNSNTNHWNINVDKNLDYSNIRMNSIYVRRARKLMIQPTTSGSIDCLTKCWQPRSKI